MNGSNKNNKQDISINPIKGSPYNNKEIINNKCIKYINYCTLIIFYIIFVYLMIHPKYEGIHLTLEIILAITIPAIIIIIINGIMILSTQLERNYTNFFNISIAILVLIATITGFENYFDNKNLKYLTAHFENIEKYLHNNLHKKQDIYNKPNLSISKNEENTLTNKLDTTKEAKDENTEFYENFILKFLIKFTELVAIAFLVSFISSYRLEKSKSEKENVPNQNIDTKQPSDPEKSESKNEQSNNPTSENNQTDTSKPEPKQSSEEKESPHD